MADFIVGDSLFVVSVKMLTLPSDGLHKHLLRQMKNFGVDHYLDMEGMMFLFYESFI